MGECWRPRAVLFDLDDTLLLTREVKWRQHVAVARDAFGIELTDEMLRAHYGKPFAVMVDEFYAHAPLADILAAIDAVKADYPKLAQPGAVELVTELLDARVAVGVVTASPTADARDDLGRCGFPVTGFALVQGADDTDRHKPDPAVFAPALARLADQGIGASEVCYVGDGIVDRDAAAAAGLRFFAVTQGMYAAEAFTGHPAASDVPGLRHWLLPGDTPA